MCPTDSWIPKGRAAPPELRRWFRVPIDDSDVGEALAAIEERIQELGGVADRSDLFWLTVLKVDTSFLRRELKKGGGADGTCRMVRAASAVMDYSPDLASDLARPCGRSADTAARLRTLQRGYVTWIEKVHRFRQFSGEVMAGAHASKCSEECTRRRAHAVSQIYAEIVCEGWAPVRRYLNRCRDHYAKAYEEIAGTYPKEEMGLGSPPEQSQAALFAFSVAMRMHAEGRPVNIDVGGGVYLPGLQLVTELRKCLRSEGLGKAPPLQLLGEQDVQVQAEEAHCAAAADALIRDLRDACRNEGPAVEAALEYVTNERARRGGYKVPKRSRRSLAEQFGVTLEQLRWAEETRVVPMLGALRKKKGV